MAPYETDQSLPKLNQIKVPLFMLFGDQKNGEMIEQTSEELIDNLNHWIKNPQKEIQFIKGSDHNYWGKEQEMANKMKRFLENLL